MGWICPAVLDPDGVAHLSSQTLQMPLPWVFDWSALEHIDAEACARLSELFRHWIPQQLDMRWLGGDVLFALLQEAAPTGVRDVDPAFWQLRLDALRMANRADQFDEAAIDYCVTYEVSPPSWERAKCQVRVSGSNPGNTTYPASQVTEVSTSFLESQISENQNQVLTGNVELVRPARRRHRLHPGEDGPRDRRCEPRPRVVHAPDPGRLHGRRRPAELGPHAAQRRSRVSFTDSHRLVALFFGAMGINEHARITVRQV